MFEAEAECTDCHLGSQNQIVRSDANKCLDCHEEGYEEMFVEWQSSVRELINSLKVSLKETRKISLTQEEKTQILNIERTLRSIELDGSSGIHNYLAIEELLTNFQKIIKSLGTGPLTWTIHKPSLL